MRGRATAANGVALRQCALASMGVLVLPAGTSRAYLPLKVRAFADFLTKKFRHGAPAEAAEAHARRRR